MKHLLITLLLLIPVLAFPQMVKTGVVTAQVVAGAAYEAEYQAVLDAMTVDPNGDTLTWQNDMVADLVAGGYWARMDLFYVFANRNSQGALLNWIAPTGDDNATDGNSTAFTVYEGFTGDGSSDYLNTNWNTSTESVNCIRDDATYGFYTRTDGQGTGYDWGTTDGLLKFNVRNTFDYLKYQINSWTEETKVGISTGDGLTVITRRGATEVETYKDGVSKGNGTAASEAPESKVLFLLRHAASYSSRQVSVFFAMNAVSDAESTEINTIIETYMDAIGKGVE